MTEIRNHESVEDLLESVLWQALGYREKGKRFVDNKCMHPYEEACKYLSKKGRLVNMDGRIYKVVGDVDE